MCLVLLVDVLSSSKFKVLSAAASCPKPSVCPSIRRLDLSSWISTSHLTGAQ